MIDEGLIAEAQTLATGADIHETMSLVRMYQAAGNGDSPQEQEAAKTFEKGLRKHVAGMRAKRYGN
jgi:hypothetical protein